MIKKSIAILIIFNILIMFIPLCNTKKAYAAPVVGNNALKSVIVGAMEKGGIKFKNASARERAVDAWNMKAYEKWKADEAAGRNKDLWAAFETYKLNPPVPEPIPDKPGFGRILLDATIYGMAFGIGWDIGTEIYNAFTNDTTTQYMSTNFSTIKDIPDLDLSLTLGLYKETVNNTWNRYQHVWTSSYKELNTPSKFTLNVYSDDPEIGEIFITKIKSYNTTNYEIFYKTMEVVNGNIIVGDTPLSFIKSKDILKPLLADGYKYQHKPVENEVPDINVPEPLKEVINDPYGMPTSDPVEIIVPIGDNPFADNPYNNPDEWTNPEPNPEPEPEPEPNPEPDSPEKVNWDKLKEIPVTFTNKFPFSLPWDIYHIVKELNVPAQKFKIDKNFKVGTVDIPIKIELPDWIDKYTPFIRFSFVVVFIIGLIYATRSLMGGGV